MRPDLRISLIVMTTVVTVIITAIPATAALFLVFDPEHRTRADATAIAQPSQRLQVRTGGSGGMGSIKKVAIFYAPQATSLPAKVKSWAELRATGAARFPDPLVADSEGNGRVTLVAPDTPGRYQIVVYCPECETAAQGSNVLWVGGIHVSGSSLPNTGGSVEFAMGMFMIGVGGMVVWETRRRPSQTE